MQRLPPEVWASVWDLTLPSPRIAVLGLVYPIYSKTRKNQRKAPLGWTVHLHTQEAGGTAWMPIKNPPILQVCQRTREHGLQRGRMILTSGHDIVSPGFWWQPTNDILVLPTEGHLPHKLHLLRKLGGLEHVQRLVIDERWSDCVAFDITLKEYQDLEQGDPSIETDATSVNVLWPCSPTEPNVVAQCFHATKTLTIAMSDSAQPCSTTCATVLDGLDMDNGILGVTLRLYQNESLDVVKQKVATICEIDRRAARRREWRQLDWRVGDQHDDFIAGPNLTFSAFAGPVDIRGVGPRDTAKTTFALLRS